MKKGREDTRPFFSATGPKSGISLRPGLTNLDDLSNAFIVSLQEVYT